MKRKQILWGMAVAALALGLVLAGCDNGTTGGGGGGNGGGGGGGGGGGETGLTVTGLESFNGKYFRVQGEVNGKYFISMDTSFNEYFKISNGKVTVPLRDVTDIGIDEPITTLPPAFTETGAGMFGYSTSDDAQGTNMSVNGNASGNGSATFTKGSATFARP